MEGELDVAGCGYHTEIKKGNEEKERKRFQRWWRERRRKGFEFRRFFIIYIFFLFDLRDNEGYFYKLWVILLTPFN